MLLQRALFVFALHCGLLDPVPGCVLDGRYMTLSTAVQSENSLTMTVLFCDEQAGAFLLDEYGLTRICVSLQGTVQHAGFCLCGRIHQMHGAKRRL